MADIDQKAEIMSKWLGETFVGLNLCNVHAFVFSPAFSKLYVERSEMLVGYVLRAYCSLLCYPQKTDLLLGLFSSLVVSLFYKLKSTNGWIKYG